MPQPDSEPQSQPKAKGDPKRLHPDLAWFFSLKFLLQEETIEGKEAL